MTDSLKDRALRLSNILKDLACENRKQALASCDTCIAFHHEGRACAYELAANWILEDIVQS